MVKTLQIFALLFVISFIIFTPITLDVNALAPPVNGHILGVGLVKIHGRTYKAEEVALKPPYPLNTTTSPTDAFPAIGGDSPWQYGIQYSSGQTMYGGGFNITIFDGGSNPSGFSFWIGLTDNLGNFWQGGFTYWGSGCSTTYEGWWVGSPGGLGVTCPPSGSNEFAYQAITSQSDWVGVVIYVYQGTWVIGWTFPNGTTNYYDFPDGSDGATSVSGPIGAIIEGSSSGTFTTGSAWDTDLTYVWKVAPSGNTLYIYVWFPSSVSVYETQNSGGYAAPPSTANLGYLSGCPYTYIQYFTSTPGTIPSSLPACVP